MIKNLFWMALVSTCFWNTACTTVKPWQREHLANYIMRPARDPLSDSISEHVWFTREAFAGGKGVGGGGCGCN